MIGERKVNMGSYVREGKVSTVREEKVSMARTGKVCVMRDRKRRQIG